MLVWLLVLLLLFISIYVVYQSLFTSVNSREIIDKEQNYTFKL